MDLSRSVIKDFVDITNDNRTKKETLVYGEIVEYNGRTYAKIDGSEELTPIASATDVKDGDRVIVSVINHEAIVSGNISNPAAGKLSLDELGHLVINDYVTFKGLSEGTTVIDGGCIKTGRIDAQYLNLTGKITFNELSEEANEAIQQTKRLFSSNLTDWHETMLSNDKYRKDWDYAKNDWGNPYQFIGEDGAEGPPGKDGADGADGSDATVPTYITETVIGKGMIQAPEVYANNFSIYPSSSTSRSGGLSIYGNYTGKQYPMFELEYVEGDGAYVNMYSPANAIINIGSSSSNMGVFFKGPVDFSDADVTGLSVTATFA